MHPLAQQPTAGRWPLAAVRLSLAVVDMSGSLWNHRFRHWDGDYKLLRTVSSKNMENRSRQGIGSNAVPPVPKLRGE
jgi:hypothetical protein